MSSDLALIMALPNESKGLFEQVGIEVHYSGIGKVNAAFKAFAKDFVCVPTSRWLIILLILG